MQRYDKRGQYDLSLSKTDEAIEHTPTVVDLYSAKVSEWFFFSLYSFMPQIKIIASTAPSIMVFKVWYPDQG